MTDFDLFWAAFPKKRSKGAARRAWNKLAPTTETVQAMLDALQWQARQPDWIKDGGQFIPYPATWLNAEGWEDEPMETPQLKDQTVKNAAAVTRWLAH